MKDFFISYTQADRTWAEWIAWQLEEAGYEAVIQAWDFRPGSNFVIEMQQGLAEAERVIAVLSPEYLTSEFTQPEWAAAFAQDPASKEGRVLPVRIRECEVPGLLKAIVSIDLAKTRDEKRAKSLLLEGVKQGRVTPAQAPGFPNAPKHKAKQEPRFPGSFPGIWNVPHNRNRNFTGREELLRSLRNSLVSGKHSALTQAIHGLGGIGKTQTAVEYAYRYAGDYDVVWWIRAEEPATLAADFAGMAVELGLGVDAMDQQAVVAAVREWLRDNRNWLLIFDNARSPEEIAPYLPQGENGHVIITSRHRAWGVVASPLPIPVLPRDEAIEFLLRRTGQTDRESAAELAEQLGDLPLALAQAAAYIETHGTRIPDYLTLFRTHRQKILSRGKPSPDDTRTVETTWEISFDRVQSSSPAAVDLLNLCAFLAPEDIPLEVIRKGADLLPDRLAAAVSDPLEFEDAVAALLQHSLVEKTDNSLSIHRLVQAVVRNRMGEGERRKNSEIAASTIERVFPRNSEDVRTWSMVSLLLSHTLSVIEHCEAEQADSRSSIYLFARMGKHFRARGQPGVAKALLTRAVGFSERVCGPEDPDLAVVLNNLSTVLLDLRELEGARAHLERALRIDEAAYGPDHPEVAADVNNLGSVLQDLGDPEGARAFLQRALRIDEAAYGPDHPIVAIRVNNLGAVLLDLGDLKGAQAHFERALRISEATYGPDHPVVAIRVSNLGSIHKTLGDLEKARMYYERALPIFTSAYGEQHPTTRTVAENLSDLLKRMAG